MKIKYYISSIGIFLAATVIPLFVEAQNSSLWLFNSNKLTPISPTWGLRIPTITGCVQADIAGNFSGTGINCGSGSSLYGQTWELFGNPSYLAPTTTKGILVSASSTISSLAVNNGTTTNATSTNFTISSLTSTRIPFSTTGGRLIDSASIKMSGNDLMIDRGGGTGTGLIWFGDDATNYIWNPGSLFLMSAPLDVLGTIGANDSSADFRIEGVGSSGNGYFGLTNSTDGDILTVNSSGFVGVASTSPWAQLSINPNRITGPAFAIGSSTNTYMVVSNGGKTTFGTSTSLATVTIYAQASTGFIDPTTYPFAIIPNKNTAANDPLIYLGQGPSTGLAGGIGVAVDATSGIGLFDRDGNTRISVRRGGTIINSTNISNCCTAANVDVALRVVPFAHSTNGGALGENQTFIVGTSSTASGALGYRIAGNYANQRFTTIGQPQITATTTFGITNNAATMYIMGAPSSLGLATIGTSTSLLIESGTSTNAGVTNAYGLYTVAPYGAVNNYAAAFMAGNVGVGSSTPFATLSVSNNANFASFAVGSTSSTTLIVTNTGKIGIGTQDPQADLHIYNNNTSGAAPSIIMGGNNGGDTDFWMGRYNTNDATNNDSFRLGTSTITGANTLKIVDYKGNEYAVRQSNYSVPVVSNCGSGAYVFAGSNNTVGWVHIGSTALQATCTITFSDGGYTLTNFPPVCQVSALAGGAAANSAVAIASTTASTIVIFSAVTTTFPNYNVGWTCLGGGSI